MSKKAPVTTLATLALLAGVVAALFGALVVHGADGDAPQLPPEHPLFGR